MLVAGADAVPAVAAPAAPQRRSVLDERHVRVEDPQHELTRAVVWLEQSGSVEDVARRLAEILRGEAELRRTFAAGCGCWSGGWMAAAGRRSQRTI